MPIQIEELDWEALDGKTLNLTVKVLGDKVYLLEGQTVRVADLSAGPVAQELPFFGPRSARTGRLTDEQQRALDTLIKEGYTAHRSAMLLGIHDSTVTHRKRQLREEERTDLGPGGRVGGASPSDFGSARVPYTRLSPEEVDTVQRLRFVEGKSYPEIARLTGRAVSTVNRYSQRLQRGNALPLPHRGGRPRLSPEVIATIRYLRVEQGLSYAVIAPQVGHSPSVVANYCRAIERGEYGGHAVARDVPVIEHEPAPGPQSAMANGEHA